MAHFTDIFKEKTEDVVRSTWRSGGEGGSENVGITLKEVKLATKTSAGGRAPGPDRVPVDVFKSAPDLWGTTVFNAALTDSIQSSWETSIIIPIYKQGAKQTPKNIAQFHF